ncbi:MAG: VPLPA-CTERM sorting domain-containing protein [Paracoccaceae bacterium]
MALLTKAKLSLAAAVAAAAGFSTGAEALTFTPGVQSQILYTINVSIDDADDSGMASFTSLITAGDTVTVEGDGFAPQTGSDTGDFAGLGSLTDIEGDAFTFAEGAGVNVNDFMVGGSIMAVTLDAVEAVPAGLTGTVSGTARFETDMGDIGIGSYSVVAFGFVMATGMGTAILQLDLTTPEAVPLPAALPMLALGLGVIGLVGTRRRG